jgi:hypothetical protein
MQFRFVTLISLSLKKLCRLNICYNLAERMDNATMYYM